MTGANACGNVGNVLSKQNKHLQRSTSKTLCLAHFCHRFALVEMLQQLVIFVSLKHSDLIHLVSGNNRNLQRNIVFEA